MEEDKNWGDIAEKERQRWIIGGLRKMGALETEPLTKSSPARIFSRLGQAEEFVSRQPVYYDKSKLWWVWNKERLFWQLSDETDILNMINKEIDLDVVSSKIKNEILTALEMIGRENKPEEANSNWIQFADGIVNISDPESIVVPNPHYFITNPLPWRYGESDETPIMDKIFAEWVGEDYVLTLYQILAYCLLPDYPIHRVFCFIGSGLNGKSCFLNLLRKFVGDNNCCSTELDTLLNSRFEVTRLHKKLVCQMGETNFSEMSKTSMLKKLSGNDLIGFEYKNKNPFEDKNYAKIIIATNNLPSTTDKTIGFYRRWLIIDFPHNFSEKKDILNDIPDKEYENLGRKCVKILKDLLVKREFHKEGSISERIERYEARSNFLETFINEFTMEDINGYITKSDFYRKFSEWCEENRHRKMGEKTLGSAMKKMGMLEGKKYFDWLYDGKGGQARVWEGIKWKV